MNGNFEETMNKLIDQLKSITKTETVIGEAFKIGDFECVPVIKMGMGFGGGSGQGEGNEGNGKSGKGGGVGAGGAIGIEPIAFLVTNGENISLLPVERSKGLQALFEKVPDLMEKLLAKTTKKETEKMALANGQG